MLSTIVALDTNASPNGWINDHDNKTLGNNVAAHLDRDDDNLPDLPRPAGNPWHMFDFSLDLNGNPDNHSDAAVVQLFYWNNWMHDVLYGLGFHEAAGNFQTDNFGRGGWAGDAVQADAQDGAGLNDGRHHNNANMSTPPDGFAPRMQMYLFDGTQPARDGSLDAEIIVHEYAHGLTSRLIGGGAGIEALQTAGMAEGWSDFYALAMLTDPATDVDATYPMGSYLAYHAFSTGFEENYYYGIRHYPYCTDTNKNPLTFMDIDPMQASAHAGVPRSSLFGPFNPASADEVHAQGEVWCAMLWEVRANLIKKYGGASGNALALQLITDGLKLSPPTPNLIQGRDAILLADRIYSGGDNAAEIWGAFAKRGLGFSAKASESYTTLGGQESYDLVPVLATEQVEIQTASASVEMGVNNNLLIHLRNQGSAAATHVTGRLATSVPGVTVTLTDSTYHDISHGGLRANDVAFQLQTGAGFVEGMPIDLEFIIRSDQGSSTNYLRLFTGQSGAEIMFNNYSAMADIIPASPAPKDLTPWDLGNAEPLWMTDDGSCLLKAARGKYLLWYPDGAVQIILNQNFLAHRLTRSGEVVGMVIQPDTFDEAGNRVSHSWGAKWNFSANAPVPLTKKNDRFLTVANSYQWPKNTGPLSSYGSVYSATLADQYGQPLFLANITSYPTLNDVWDMNSHGVAVGSLSMQINFAQQLVYFDLLGTMDWFKTMERGLDAGFGESSRGTQTAYWAQLTTAAQFNSQISLQSWRLLGPLNWQNTMSYATLINDAGMIAGAGAVYLGNPVLDTLRPTHAFRISGTDECAPFASIMTDLGALPRGLHSFPRTMNGFGEIAGNSDYNPYVANSFHGVFWGEMDQTPQDLGTLGAVPGLLEGFSDAYAINDKAQIVGTSWFPTNNSIGYDSAAVLWQRNRNGRQTPFWEITDLNKHVNDSDWSVTHAVGIDNNGLILAQAVDASGAKHAVLLMQMAMAVDNNRDGQISLDDGDKTSSTHPFRFWINDDNDSGDTGGNDVPDQPVMSANYKTDYIPGPSSLGYVDGTRDLIDFFPVYLNMQQLLALLPSTGAKPYTYKLKHADGAINVVFTSFKRTDATKYQTDYDNAQTLIMRNPQYYPREVTATGLDMPASFLESIINDEEKGVFLVEGRAASTVPLVLSVERNGKVVCKCELSLSISGVEQMFRHINLNYVSGKQIEVLTRLREPSNWPDNLCLDKNFIFIHGYNVNQQQARGWAAEWFKRMWWAGSKAKFYTLSWRADESQVFKTLTINLQTNIMHAFQTAPVMATILNNLPGENIVAAHSLGNMLTSAAITMYGCKAAKYFMIDGAVAIEAFDPDSVKRVEMVNEHWDDYYLGFGGEDDDYLFASEWYKLFPVNDPRSNLTWRGIFTNWRDTRVFNFYSSGEEVMGNIPHGAGDDLVTPVDVAFNLLFVKNYPWGCQEKLKGRMPVDILGSPIGGWGFNQSDYGTTFPSSNPEYPDIWLPPNPTSTHSTLKSQLMNQPFFGKSPRDLFSTNEDIAENYAEQYRFDLLARAIPVRTFGVGANPVPNVFEHSIDLQTFQTGWPSSRGPDLNWLHSDCRNVAYIFTHSLYENIVGKGALK